MRRKRTSRRANIPNIGVNSVMNTTMKTMQLGMGISAMGYAFGTTANLLKK